MSTLDTQTIKELINTHNDHCEAAGVEPIKSFKGRKDDLVAIVSNVIRKGRGKTIREVAEALLIEVVETKDGQKIGRPYAEVLEMVLAEFPEANTTVKCLRWYNTKLNGEPSVKMPIRPRKKAAPKVEVATTNDETSETPIIDAIIAEADPCA